ncbi:unnamed protein product [Cuscuta epithymum]|uniref:Uncharacterized protein n=1 Tax=Cuscuta epithymum TaxID=186058 RepID=A0AAV0EHT1_9ASTE|nr:unnamed protein product [Cuscuta epithymum]
MGMDVPTFRKADSLSSSTALPLLSSPGNTNENLRNRVKPHTKHFMSSTISATSKSATKKKNILGERNEADSSYTPRKSLSNTPNTNFIQKSSSANLSQNCTPELNDDSSSNMYDPITNYLSPRPKYLRYKPNRRRELFLELENKKITSSDDEGSMGHAQGLPLPPQDDTLHLENKENVEEFGYDVESDDEAVKSDKDEKEEEEEEEEEEENEEEEEEKWFEHKSCSFNRWLKFLLLTMVVFLFPLFVSWMDDPPSLPSTETVMNGFSEIYHGFGVLPFDVNGSVSEHHNEIELSPSIDLWKLDDIGEIGMFSDVAEVQLLEDENDISMGNNIRPSEECCVQELEKETIETDENEAFDQFPVAAESIENNKADDVYEMEEGGSDPLKQYEAGEMTPERLSENDNPSGVIQEPVVVEPTASKESITEEFLEETEIETNGEDTVPSSIVFEQYTKESADVAVNNILQQIQQLTPAAAIIATLSLLPLLILAYAYSARHPRIPPPQQQSKPAVEPGTPNIDEKIEATAKASPLISPPVEEYHRYSTTNSNLLPSPECISSYRVEMENTPETNQLWGVSREDSSFSLLPLKDSRQEFSGSGYTKSLEVVELLGELVIGGEEVSSSSLMKKSKLLSETEESSYSISHFSDGSPIKLHHHPMETPISDSSSYERYSTGRKLPPKKKQGSKDGESTKKATITTTPVRRSTRLRNRGTMSSP